MNKHLIVIGIVVLLLAVGLSGCNENISQSDEDRIVGTWISTENFGDDYTLTTKIIFLSDKTFTSIMFVTDDDIIEGGGTWNIVDNKLVAHATSPEPRTRVSDYSFSDNYNKLMITFKGVAETYTRQ